ncbi:MAG: hypothetical protein J6N49_07130 [Alphaproteobacteria bacterium]|nr:hypothetical protein [Alphaproteobacteria bacterium]
MEENQVNAPRKLRKIKRPRPNDGQPISFGMPSKVNYESNISDNYVQEDDNYFANNGSAENIHFITEEEMMPQNVETISDLLRNKTVVLLLCIAGLFGAILSYLMAPAQQNVSKRGLDGVVFNSDVPAGRSRCGLTEPHQGCVLYIMNPRNQEVIAREFYQTAAKWTQRERYIIETGNMHYSTTKIKPGYIAQINIPPL